MAQTDNLVDITQQYYDSHDADNFYFHVWGGEDIHIGMYRPGDSISDASQRTVASMADMLQGVHSDSHLLDIGAGYGGAARYLVDRFSCKVDCLNLSQVENNRNIEKNKALGVSDRISVVTGNFEQLPFEADQYDIVWSEDAILHSDNKQKVFEEVNRVMKPGGQFIFSDPMQRNDCPSDVLEPVLARIHLKEMGSVAKYKAFAEALGWEVISIKEMPEQLVNHYSNVLAKLEEKYDEMQKTCSETYLTNMRKGLNHWIDAGKKGYLNWGFLHFRNKG